MKRKLIVTGVVAMLLFIGIGGCEDFDIEACAGANYITVIVEARVYATVTDHFDTVPWSGAVLNVEIVKAGGERVSEQRTTDSGGNTEPVNATFKVYKEQGVQAIARVVSGPMPEFMGVESWDPQKLHISNNYAFISWEDIEHVGYKGTYYWYPTVDLSITTPLR